MYAEKSNKCEDFNNYFFVGTPQYTQAARFEYLNLYDRLLITYPILLDLN